MANKIQIRRGTLANLPTLAAGELAWCSDDPDVIYAGDGSANHRVGGTQLPAFYKHNLVVKTTGAGTLDIDADELVVEDSSGDRVLLEDVDLSVSIASSGANGLDTGSEAASTMYYVWVIYNGTTVAGLLSTSSSAPTLPSGYTYKRLAGEVYNDSGGDLEDSIRYDDTVNFTNPQAVYTATGLTSSWVAKNLPAAVPSGCTRLRFEAGAATYGTRTAAILRPSSSAGNEFVAFNLYADSLTGQGLTGSFNNVNGENVHNGATSIYVRSAQSGNMGNQELHIWGYTLAR